MLPVADIRQVHEWFLHRGLPLVLARRVRSRALIERSAPMVSGVGAVISLTMMLAELTDGDPDFGYVTRLGVLTLLLIAAPFALYRLHQSGTTLGEAGRRSAALLVMALFVFGLPFAASGFSGIAAVESFGLAIIGAGDLADLHRVRLDRVVGVPLCLGTGGCARHIDESRVAAAHVDGAGLFHR
jgi:hypothetical protein